MNRPDIMTDSRHLRTSQYSTDANLQKRIALHQRFSTNPEPWMRWLFDQIAFPSSPSILEVGCGAGTLWDDNRERLPVGLRLTLTDLSDGMVRTAAARLGDSVSHAQVADAQRLPYTRDAFDVVIANHMLYHVPAIGQAISEIHRVLRPGGVLIASTNGQSHMVETHDLLGTITGKAPDRGIATRFSLEGGGAMLEEVFPQVERRDYPCDLEVMEVAPVIDYLASTAVEDGLTDGDLAKAEAIVAAIIARDGVYRITKSSGVFIAHRGEAGVHHA